METILLALFAKAKYWIAGFVTGAIFYYFEVQIGRMKFHVGRFIISCATFGFLTEFSRAIVFGWYTGINHEKSLVLSIAIASFLYLFLPFVLKEENRGAFIQSILNKFGFEQKK